MTHGPLTGLVVADFTRVLAGPYCTMLLGDLGATVVKVEGPSGDETRQWLPPARDGEATYYLSVNRNKRTITLDLEDADDLATARRLARRADVVVENFKPGGLARFGLDHAAVRRDNPGVVYASITGFGADSELPGYDVLAQALSGLMSVTGTPEGEPAKAGVAIVDVVTGLHAAVGILAALRHREATGEGQHVEVNLLSSALSALANQSGAFALAGVVPRRLGNDHPSIYPYGPFPTADGHIVIAVGNDVQYARLATALGLEPDDRFATARERTARRDELRPVLHRRSPARPRTSGTPGCPQPASPARRSSTSPRRSPGRPISGSTRSPKRGSSGCRGCGIRSRSRPRPRRTPSHRPPPTPTGRGWRRCSASELGQDRRAHPGGVALGAPSRLRDQLLISLRREQERQGGGGGLGIGDTCGVAAREKLIDEAAVVRGPSFEDPAEGGIHHRIGCRGSDEHGPQGVAARIGIADLSDHHIEERGVRHREDIRGHLGLRERRRSLHTGERHLERGDQQLRLRGGGLHGLGRHARRPPDRRQSRGLIPLGREQLRRRFNDPAAGLGGLLGAQCGAVDAWRRGSRCGIHY